MSQEEEAAIERACERLMQLYARAVDSFDIDAFATLFTEDAELHMPAGVSLGREKIRKGFSRRDPALVSRHMITNVLVEPLTATTAQGSCYLTLFRSHPIEAGAPHDPLRPALVGEYRDAFRKTPEGWRFSRRELVVGFAP